MQIQVIVFGQLTDIIGKNSLTLSGVKNTDALINELTNQFPALANRKYIIAVNQQVIEGNTVLPEHSTVALLPPFSGG